MIRRCLDTTGYSRLMRGNDRLRERLEEADEVLLPVTLLGELYAGFQGGRWEEENRGLLAVFRRHSRPSRRSAVAVARAPNSPGFEHGRDRAAALHEAPWLH